MILGHYIGFDESIQDEFKEFSIKLDPYAFCMEEDIKTAILTGKLFDSFNDLILQNINHYLKFYVPKYISAFGNMKSETTTASLYIGINDFGEITGIPFRGKLELDYIGDMKDSLKIFLNTKNLDSILSRIKLEVIQLSTGNEILDDNIDQIIKDYHVKYAIYKVAYSKYVSEYRIWIEQIDTYNIKIITYIVDPMYRAKLADYIRKKTNNSEYLKFADQLLTDYVFDVIPNHEIIDKKIDPLNIYHWATNFKDDTLDEIKLRRPVRPPAFVNELEKIYENQFSILTNLRKRFIINNSDLNYYLIKIIIPTNNEHEISFSNLGSNTRWYTRTRYLVDGIPCCI